MTHFLLELSLEGIFHVDFDGILYGFFHFFIYGRGFKWEVANSCHFKKIPPFQIFDTRHIIIVFNFQNGSILPQFAEDFYRVLPFLQMDTTVSFLQIALIRFFEK